MATNKPISTVTYNSEKFLQLRLNEWFDSHLIMEWSYIKHIGEDGDKDHFHLRIVPNRRLDPMDLRDLLKEYDPKKPDKPLGCLGFRPSKEEDWLLYVTHNKEYLKNKYGSPEKGEKIPYDYDKIVTSDGFMLEQRYIRALGTLNHTTSCIAKQIQDGKSPFDLILSGENPHIVNAITHSLNQFDYLNLLDRHNSLIDCIIDLGYTPYLDDNNVYHLEKS